MTEQSLLDQNSWKFLTGAKKNLPCLREFLNACLITGGSLAYLKEEHSINICPKVCLKVVQKSVQKLSKNLSNNLFKSLSKNLTKNYKKKHSKIAKKNSKNVQNIDQNIITKVSSYLPPQQPFINTLSTLINP